MWSDKESLKTAILQIRDLIKNVKNFGASHEAMKKQLKELEDIYRYHYEGGNRPAHLPASLNDWWVGCHTCDWEKQLDDNESKDSLKDSSCGNCQKNLTADMCYLSNNRKGRSSNSWVDSSKEHRERKRERRFSIVWRAYQLNSMNCWWQCSWGNSSYFFSRKSVVYF